MSDCCHPPKQKKDWLWILSSWTIATMYGLHLLHLTYIQKTLQSFSESIFELMNKMLLGIALGIVFVGLLSLLPRSLVQSALGSQNKWKKIVKATVAGLMFDLCSHGILMVGMKLYERGASIGQVMAFLIASPWNSFSLTIILAGLIGIPWTMLFILGSALIALITGLLFDELVERKVLPANPQQMQDTPSSFLVECKQWYKNQEWSISLLWTLLIQGWKESRMILKWVFVGTILAAAIRVGFSQDHFEHWFGATLSGLGLTLLAATIIEVCSEGSTPIAADLFHRAHAPGNAFSFLMAGASTDYTEIMGIREQTKSMKIALFLPLLTLPQIVALALLMNHFR
ncbi:MAG: permease [Bdellovibrionales bacterium]|nr:permease [Bdellovibrionales bacterium]